MSKQQEALIYLVIFSRSLSIVGAYDASKANVLACECRGRDDAVRLFLRQARYTGQEHLGEDHIEQWRSLYSTTYRAPRLTREEAKGESALQSW